MFCTTLSAERFIACQPWFASVPTDLQEKLRQGVYSTEGAKGAVMLPAGSAVEGWHAVLSGLVMLQSPASRGRASAFIGVSDGDWFGEGSAMKPEPRKYDVVALRPTHLLCLPLPLFATLRETSLAFNQFLVLHMNLRLGQAMAIIEAGRMRSATDRGEAVAEVRSAVALTDEQISRLAAALKARTNLDVTVKNIVDPTVMGGVVTQIGDSVLDGSVRTRLNQLRDAF